MSSQVISDQAINNQAIGDWVQTFWLSILQGLTEFLPISSSGHLILLPSLLGWEDQGLVFDVAVHVGTLIAVVFYFRKEVLLLVTDWARSLLGGPVTVYSRLAWAIGFATVFVGVAGVLFESLIDDVFRNPIPIAIATIVFGIVLGLTDRYGKRVRDIHSVGWRDVCIIGFAQAIALIPGTSRSGITISAGLAVGLTREAAARFSFLLSIPVILLAGGWQGRKLLGQGNNSIDIPLLIFAIMISALFAFICIHYFLRFIDRVGLMPFVIYRLFLGIILILVFM
ncbi:MAG: undecaprenyl-diphosphate phosphatase [Gammaproteobacteria bacterium]|nr:undecaprenyl-diphosphate phosphatase [Gammaproteobacteria bacterium]NKB64132.1 undecaprenyl-diphosphate phosphatase [Gammaproteobacteria bacterium]